MLFTQLNEETLIVRAVSCPVSLLRLSRVTLRRVADRFDRLRVSLPTSLSAAASSVVAGIQERVVFPDLRISPKCVSRGEGHLLTFNGHTDLVFALSRPNVTLSYMQQIPIFSAVMVGETCIFSAVH